MTAYGPSRHFAATQQFSRFRGEADIGGRVPIVESDARDQSGHGGLKEARLNCLALKDCRLD